jgi:two-component system response regulator RegX3
VEKRRVLLIEDEMAIAEPLSAMLREEGFEPLIAGTASDGLEAFRRSRPDVILLDVVLPDGDGRDVLREIRAVSRIPVVMLTVRNEELDKVVGLELGADDYVTKPFGAAELIARIRAVLRRSTAPPPGEPSAIEIGDVRIDLATRTVTRSGEPLALTVREFDLLRVLMENASHVVRRGELMDEVWDVNWWGSTKTLDIHVSSLRKKLGDDAASPRYIHTARGVGFRFASAAELSDRPL